MTFTLDQIKSASNPSVATPGAKLSYDPNASTMQTLSSAPSTSYGSQVVSNLGQNFQQGGDQVTSDIKKTPVDTSGSFAGLGKNVLNDLITAGHLAGDVAKTAGGIIGSFIAPILPEKAKQGLNNFATTVNNKISSIPGMTPQIQQGIGDVFNTITLLGGAKAEPVASELVKGGLEKAGTLTENIKNGLKSTSPSEVTPKVEPISFEQQAVTEAQGKLQGAQQAREAVVPQAVEGVKTINKQVGAYKASLGEQFASDAAKIEKTNPDLKLNLTNDQLKTLNSLKEGKNFVLPKSIDANIPDISVGGKEVNLGPNVQNQLQNEIGKTGAQTSVSLSPTQAQDLIRELNRSTFKEAADGTRQIDQQRIGITNEIKNAANETFGKSWQDIYSKYAEGRTAIDKIDNLVNLDPKATPEEINGQLTGILKLSKTPEGKLLLKQSLEEYKQTSGVDLSNPVKAIQQIIDKQLAQDLASKNLTATEKVALKAEALKIKTQAKGGFFKQVGTQIKSPQAMTYLIRRGILWGGMAWAIKQISNAVKGK